MVLEKINDTTKEVVKIVEEKGIITTPMIVFLAKKLPNEDQYEKTLRVKNAVFRASQYNLIYKKETQPVKWSINPNNPLKL